MNPIYQGLDILACATCMLDRSGTAQQATNLGIFMMLGALMLVFSCIGLAAFNFIRRARSLAKSAVG